MKPLFVSCFTPDDIYGPAADRLRMSLEKFALDFEVHHFQPLGSWVENTCYKPLFIKAMLDKHRGRPIVWLDADAEVVAYPGLLMDMTADVATGYLSRRREYLSGTVFLANNVETRNLVRLWLVNLQQDDDSPRKEQRALGRAIEALMGNGLIYERLPFEYVRIFDLKGRDEVPVILHKQLSRVARKVYG